jgi:hypothetical protein
MKNEPKKDYANVAAISREYLEWKDKKKDDKQIPTPQELHAWQVQFQLIMAQQLTVIAGHLGRIVAAAQDAKDGE